MNIEKILYKQISLHICFREENEIFQILKRKQNPQGSQNESCKDRRKRKPHML